MPQLSNTPSGQTARIFFSLRAKCVQQTFLSRRPAQTLSLIWSPVVSRTYGCWIYEILPIQMRHDLVQRSSLKAFQNGAQVHRWILINLFTRQGHSEIPAPSRTSSTWICKSQVEKNEKTFAIHRDV